MNDAIKTSKGRKPARKIRTVAQISACADSAAAVPISGASAHIDHETRFGLVLPVKVSRI